LVLRRLGLEKPDLEADVVLVAGAGGDVDDLVPRGGPRRRGRTRVVCEHAARGAPVQVTVRRLEPAVDARGAEREGGDFA
jgi:hypothetical protein